MGLRSVAARLTALLGNLAFHLGDHTGAQAHPAAATLLGERCGDHDLRAWAYGAVSIVARADRCHQSAPAYAEHGLALARTPLRRAQLPSWTPGVCPTKRSWLWFAEPQDQRGQDDARRVAGGELVEARGCATRRHGIA
ncbi:hypothetical protein [Embleya sp. MST-111070]|uniref:hypothetical protein n=1 Tax=Embleya sp. MST-111070 TaxID=3398231 RepID=UPI003F735E7A